MELFETESEQKMSREDAAKRLHEIADVLARNNQIELEKNGRRITVAVPDEVELSVELEVGEDNELEIEISW
ncbi:MULTISPECIES: amphi-Trp domain-containing protein [Nocardioides]|uniref:Amphi-Trp domain-containing protein n=1 Tax=Nocardioides caricicola TaxID=634770 RepID=A0ABW0MYY7_9ACTN|nr:amphi-Trp domain-containing protein [Nocardioides sp. SR21]